jgi:hypothetical protein
MAPASEPLSRTPLSLRPFLGGKEDEGRWSKNSMRLHRQVPVVCKIVCMCAGVGWGWVGVSVLYTHARTHAHTHTTHTELAQGGHA